MNQIRITENIVVDMDMCIETDPCIHNVIRNGQSMELDGRDIYQLFKENNMPAHPHFSYYSSDFDCGSIFD
jgi:hypothetical protein